ncbi:iron donor protein CyaY [Shewanella sp. NIFS-20-20]|uniref:iron donor protein CyaY n=1 Tax=Shewanella sp. NIFS-20-20 TaxID=2853806 RepID=UPI001C45E573|nr:iron donor protein CyaY [Shewanella sp. NIFS-20-20]MBV7317267.1 iron donor protein CyaY [Shewanella sp. NIFS-20-20]
MTMTDTEFHRLADEMFQQIENAIENAIDNDDADVDIDASGGVLQLEFEDGSKIVINKQEPLHQIWVATRFGGHHFEYRDGQWLDNRSDSGEFMPFIQKSIARQSNIHLSF